MLSKKLEFPKDKKILLCNKLKTCKIFTKRHFLKTVQSAQNLEIVQKALKSAQ